MKIFISESSTKNIVAKLVKKGDRIIINAGSSKSPEYYIVTITMIRSGKWYFKFDDGDKGHTDDANDMVGFVKKEMRNRKRKTAFGDKELSRYLVETAKVKETPKKQNTDVDLGTTDRGVLSVVEELKKAGIKVIDYIPPSHEFDGSVQLDIHDDKTYFVEVHDDGFYSLIRERDDEITHVAAHIRSPKLITQYAVDLQDSVPKFVKPKPAQLEFGKWQVTIDKSAISLYRMWGKTYPMLTIPFNEDFIYGRNDNGARPSPTIKRPRTYEDLVDLMREMSKPWMSEADLTKIWNLMYK